MPFAVENLQVYQEAVDLADQILAEGNGRFTKPDRKHFFAIAHGSLQEAYRSWSWRHVSASWNQSRRTYSAALSKRSPA